MAAGAYRALADHGLRIPDDVAIVGFDGLPRGPLLDPPLTTVVQPVGEVGRTAVELLAADLKASTCHDFGNTGGRPGAYPPGVQRTLGD